MNSLTVLINKFLEKEYRFIFFLFSISLFSRVIIAYLYGDRDLENEWMVLVENLYFNNSLSLLKFDDFFLPNLWMPPIYAYFAYLHALIFGFNENLAFFIICSQILLSSLTAILFYKLLKQLFSKEISCIGSLIFSLFPIIVFSASQISSVTIYMFLFIIFILIYFKLLDDKKLTNILLFGILSGVLLLTRRDFICIYFFSLFYGLVFFKINYRKILLIFFITTITISPYIVRNYIAFDKIILHSGLGYNVWKAYNPKSKVEGYLFVDRNLKEQLKKVPKDINYRINEDKIYLSAAKNYILEDPKKYFGLFLERIFSFYFYDRNSSQIYYYNAFHLYPNILIGIFSVFGLIIYEKKNKKYNFIVVNMMIILLVYSLFALLPRYKVYILPFQIILSLFFIRYCFNKLVKKN